MVGKMLFTAGGMALLGSAGAAYVEYSTYQDNDCVNVISTSIYAGVPSECRKEAGWGDEMGTNDRRSACAGRA